MIQGVTHQWVEDMCKQNELFGGVLNPILFRTNLVERVGELNKTETRRLTGIPQHATNIEWSPKDQGWWASFPFEEKRLLKSPYGLAGDFLWVRETHRIGAWNEKDEFAVDYKAGLHPRREWLSAGTEERAVRYLNQSLEDAEKAYGKSDRYGWEPGESPCRWRPSIHMPLTFVRYLLRVKDVWIERVQNMTEEGAIAEGLEPLQGGALSEFSVLWNDIHGKEYRDGMSMSWQSNPLVWVVRFELVTP